MKSFKTYTAQIDEYEKHSTAEHVNEKHQELSAHYDTSRYTPKEKAAVYDYTHNSTNVNKSLRKHAGSDLYKTLPKKHYDIQAGIHSIIAKGPGLAKPLEVYHGTPHGFHTQGDVVTTHGFTSTSLNSNTAEWFSGGKGKHVLKFKLPAGYKGGVYIDHMKRVNDALLGNEHEYVLGHNQKWRRGDQYTTPSGHTVTELHPHE